MELSLLQSFAQYWPAVLIMAMMIYWFTKQTDKKDLQNQSNLDRFIMITEKYSILTEKIANSLDGNIQKLNEIHDDIKIIKGKR